MGKQIRYTSEFKIQTVQLYLQGDVSATQLAIDLGIHPHTVRHWIRDYNDGKMMAVQPAKSMGSKGNDISNIPLHGQTECSRRPEIGLIISKLNGMEAELKDLKNTLQAYLFL